MARSKLVQKGTGNDLFVYMHIEPESPEVAVQAARATRDTVFVDFWGNGTSAYKTVIPYYGGWRKLVASIAARAGRASFDHVCLTTWSAGSHIIKAVCRGADYTWPDAIVSLDGLYGTKPPGARAGDGNVIFDVELQAVADYALAAARGDRIMVILHSSISTPYGSSGECANLIRAYVERSLGREMELDQSLAPADLDRHEFAEALVLGNLHIVEFAGRDAAEHIREAHLFDEVWRKWIPWATDDAPSSPPSGASSPLSAGSSPLSDEPGTTSAAAAPTTVSRTLRLGDKGDDVGAVQAFLRGAGGIVHLVVDGDFGALTQAAVKTFQRAQGLTPDGVVGPKTIAKMRELGLGAAADAPPPDVPFTVANDPFFPRRPSFAPLVGNAARAAVFGRIEYVSAPVPVNPEAIRITNGWDRDHIVMVEIPQLAGGRVAGAPANGRVPFHKLVAPSAVALFAAWEAADLMHLVKTWDGSWVPRFIRGSRSTLSNHAFGTAMDLNARWNPMGTRGAPRGALGSVYELIPLANEHGFYSGLFFDSRPDPMHFEAARMS
jgi:peptidoglycan hydrolase-like protein with peptidoglycan-binding domain